MPQIREQIAMVHLPPSKTLKYLFHVRKTHFKRPLIFQGSFAIFISPTRFLHDFTRGLLLSFGYSILLDRYV